MTCVPEGAGRQIRLLGGGEVLEYATAMRSVYAQTFAAAPWHETPAMADEYQARLAEDAQRPGFVSACAVLDGEFAGFATARTTPSTLPGNRCYPQVAALLGVHRCAEWLSGAREVDELAVLPSARGSGLGTALLTAVTAAAPQQRSWLLTSPRADGALRFYRSTGWHQVTHPAPEGRAAVVFLSPLHPAVDSVFPPDSTFP